MAVSDETVEESTKELNAALDWKSGKCLLEWDEETNSVSGVLSCGEVVLAAPV